MRIVKISDLTEEQKKQWEKDLLKRKEEISNNKQLEIESANRLFEENVKKKEEKKRNSENTWFKGSGLFDDGYQFGDIIGTGLSTIGDIGTNVVKGVANIGEGIGDALSYLEADIIDWSGNSNKADQIRKNTQQNLVEGFFSPAKDFFDQNSVLGNKSDNIAEGLGYVAGMTAVAWASGGAATALGASAGTASAAASVASTAATFTSAMGNGITEALNDGASIDEARLYGVISGAGEAASELMFGGLGKASGAIGLSKGVGELDDMVIGGLTKNIKNKMVKRVMQYGLKASGEGFEEIVSGLISSVGKKVTYMSDRDLKDIVKDEKLGEQFWMGCLTSAIAQGPSLRRSTRTKSDYLTGKTYNEQKVYDTLKENKTNEIKTKKTINNMIDNQVNRLQELYGRNLSTEEINSIKEAVNETYQAGRLNIEDTRLNAKEKSIIDEEVNKALEEGNVRVETIKNILGENVDLSNDGLLQRSLYEDAQKYESYQVENSDNEKVNILMQSANEAGLNNTTKTRKKVELISKLVENTDRQYKFVNEEQLTEMGYNKNANGLTDKSTGEILISVNSNKEIVAVVGHETTHLFDSKVKGEYTQEYKDLQDAVTSFLKANGTYENKINQILETYGNAGINLTQEQIMEEVTADTIGDNLFGDNAEQFIKQLSSNRNVFQKIYDYIKKAVQNIKGYNSEEAKQLQNLKDKFEKVYKTLDIEYDKNSDTKYEIKINSKNQKYVKADRQVITGDNPKEWQKQTQKYINEKIRNNQDVNILTDSGDVLTITKDTAGKAKFRNEVLRADGTRTTMSNEELLTKLTAETHIDELAQISTKTNKEPVYDTKKHKFAKDGFDYRRAYFEDFDGTYYRITMSVGKNGSVDTIYNIGRLDNMSKKNRSKSSVTAQRPLSQKTNEEDLSSNNSIASSQEKSNTNIKYSMSETEKNTIKQAKELFGTTTDFREAGYLLADGTLLDFSGKNQGSNTYGKRTLDHRDINEIGYDMEEFIEMGNIRLQPETNSFELMKEPTIKQYDLLKQYINNSNKELFIDIYINGKMAQYDSARYKQLTSADKIISDIQYYFKNGKFPEKNELSEFRYSISQGETDQYWKKKTLEDEVGNKKVLENSKKSSFNLFENIDSEVGNYDKTVEEVLNQTPEEKEQGKFPTLEKNKENKKLTRKEIKKQLIEEMGITLDDIAQGKDIAAMNYQFTDSVRVNEKVFGRKIGQKINDATINQTKHNTAEKIRWQNKEREEIKALGIKARSKESAAVQKYGEKHYIDNNGKMYNYGDKELALEFTDIKTQDKIKNAAKVIRSKYDTYIEQINNVITSLGYDEIPKRKDYMRHFQELTDMFSQTGVPFNLNDMKAEDLPTDINGLTEFNKPGKSYFASAMKRTGEKTTLDAITGIDGYLEVAGNLLFHTKDIQNYRAVSSLIRDTYGQTHGLDNIENMTDAEFQQRLEDIKGNKLSKYVAWLDEQANALAGKKGAIDRGPERLMGRKVYEFINNVKQQVGSNMTGFNVRSAISNFVSTVVAASKTKKVAFVKGTVSTINNMLKNDDFIDKSDFLTARFGSDTLSKKTWQKISNMGQIFMTGTDYFTSNVIVRSKYYEGLANNMTESEAIKYADDFAARVMGDRSQGATPELFNSKILGIFSQFQLEVNNQLQFMIHDTKMDYQINSDENNGLKAGAAVVFNLGQLAVYSHLFSELTEKLGLGNMIFDPIEIIKKLFGLDDEDKDKSFEERLSEAGELLVDAIPMGNIFTGKGKIPISEAFMGIDTLKNKLTGGKDKYGGEITWEDTKKSLIEALPYWILPTGYSQIKKTYNGLKMYSNDVPGNYTDKGDLRYTVDDDVGSKIQAALFGAYSNPYAQDYIKSGYKTIKKQNIEEMVGLDMNSTEYRNYKAKLSKVSNTSDKNGYKQYVDSKGNVYWYDSDNEIMYNDSYKKTTLTADDLTKVSKKEEALNYIDSLDISDEKKNIMANNLDKSSKKKIDMSTYGNYNSYEEYKYARDYPEKYNTIMLIDSYDNYNTYKDKISQISKKYKELGEDLTDKQKTQLAKQKKSEIRAYIEDLPLNMYQKIILEKEAGGYSIKDYKNHIYNYLEEQNLTQQEKYNIWKELFD